MNNPEDLKHRIGFLEGTIEGIRLYAIWKNGEQLVGCMERPLKEVLKPYQDELTRLRASLSTDSKQPTQKPTQ